MKESDQDEFVRLIRSVAIYYNREIEPDSYAMYFQGLKEFDLIIIRMAIQKHQTSPEDRGSFMPLISDIKKIIIGRQQDHSFIAWSKVINAIEKFGAYHDVVFDDPRIHAAIGDMGGWLNLSDADYERLSYMQHNFIQIYNSYLNREKFEYKNKLTGRRASDLEYINRGMEIPRPKYIGDERRAAEVEKSGIGANDKIKTVAQLHQLADENTKRATVAQDVPDWLVGYVLPAKNENA